MARDVRMKTSATKQNIKRAKVSRRSVDRRAKRNRKQYIKSHRIKKKINIGRILFRESGFYLDYSLMFIMLILIGLGLVMVYSSSSTTTQSLVNIIKSQVLFAIVGIVLMLIEARVIDYHWFTYPAVAYGLYIASLMLVLLLLSPLGYNYNGATRWIEIGPISFMPVEIVKVGIIAAMTCNVVSLGDKINKIGNIVIMWILYGVIPAGMLYVISNNLSSAIIVMGICFLITFFAYPGYKLFVGIVGIGIAAAIAIFSKIMSIINSGSNFRFKRILAWLHPEDYADTTAYQTIHGLYAIGSGGLFGKGLGKSIVKVKLPEAYNDMIFSIICEELGLFGALCVLLAFGVLLWRIAHVARNAPDMQGALLCAGVFAHISIQVLVNIAVVTGTIPNTGVTLPFISKGGSAILILLLEMGVVFNVSSQIKDDLNE